MANVLLTDGGLMMAAQATTGVQVGVRYVESDDDMIVWRDKVIADEGLSSYAKMALWSVSGLINRRTWKAETNKSEIARHIGMPQSTLHKYWEEAEDSGYVRRVSSHEYQAGKRKLLGPTLRLTFPE